MKDLRGQMIWVQRNRGRPQKAIRAGVAAERLENLLRKRNANVSDSVLRVLGELVDIEFRQHCRIGDICGGVLTIYVDRPELVYLMSIRWSLRLRERLLDACRMVFIDKVAFEVGHGGLALAEIKVG